MLVGICLAINSFPHLQRHDYGLRRVIKTHVETEQDGENKGLVTEDLFLVLCNY